jgi:hypothetical protein
MQPVDPFANNTFITEESAEGGAAVDEFIWSDWIHDGPSTQYPKAAPGPIGLGVVQEPTSFSAQGFALSAPAPGK